MSAKTNHVKIGVFVLVGLTLFLGGLFAFGVRSQFEPKTKFETYVAEDVEGLSVGSPVKLRGVPIGKVTLINFTWNSYPGGRGYVLVEFEIKDSISPLPPGDEGEQTLQTEVRKGLRARIRSQGITGTSFVSLEYLNPAEYPPPPIEWAPVDLYIPAAPGQFSEMLSSIEKSLRSLEKLDFELLSRSLQQNLEGLGKVLRQVEALEFAHIGTNVNGLVTELRVTNGKLKEFLDETTTTVRDLKLDGLVQRADLLLSELTELAGTVDRTLESLDTAPLGPTLLNAQQAADQLNAVLHELKQYPSGFLFGQPPPPARSVERPRK